MSPQRTAAREPGYPGARKGNDVRRRTWPGVVLATVGSNLFLALGTLVLGTVVLALCVLPSRQRWFYRFSRVWSRGLILTARARPRIHYEEALSPELSYVFMPNHQSMLDIPVLIAAVPFETRFLAKRSLFRIPVFGWAMRVGGFVSVDRDDRSHATETFSFAMRNLRGGVSLVIFPEETRSRDGRMLPFKRGGFLMALKSGLPIVPVGIQGTGAARPKGSWRVRPQPVEISFGRPIDVTAYGLRRKDELVATVEGEVRKLARAP